jgi:membrane peptidoglycan carboxypeptidase
MKAYAKTGTSSESNDLWMVAGTPYYVGSVWYGFDLRQTVNSTSAAATIWRNVMRDVHQILKYKNFTYSENVVMMGSGYYKKGSRPDNLELLVGQSSSEEATTESQVAPVPEGGEPAVPGDTTSSEVVTSTDENTSENSSVNSETEGDTSSGTDDASSDNSDGDSQEDESSTSSTDSPKKEESTAHE